MSTPSESDRRNEFLGRLEREERRQDAAHLEREAEDTTRAGAAGELADAALAAVEELRAVTGEARQLLAELRDVIAELRRAGGLGGPPG